MERWKHIRLNKARIPPIKEEDRTLEQQAIIDSLIVGPTGTRIQNLRKTWLQHPTLMKRWQEFARYLYRESMLPPRDREVAILRISWLCKAEYAWSRHAIIGKHVGLTEHEINRIAQESFSDAWSDFDATLIHAVDELHGDAFISDTTWNALAKHYSTKQLMDFVLFVGEYTMISMIVNSLGVQLDEGVNGFPDVKH